MLQDLTICTVSFQSAELIELNILLTRKLNPHYDINWLIVDNNNDFAKKDFKDSPGIHLLTGDPAINQGKFKGSYHHAQALNKALQNVSTRFALFLDPDFFIIQDNWIEKVLQRVVQKNLSFWGAPYHPRLSWKRRYFPTVSCLLIDLEKVEKRDLDFTPELDEYYRLATFSNQRLISILFGSIPSELSNWKRATIIDISKIVLLNRLIKIPLSKILRNRIYPNTAISRDTGFQIQNSFSKKKTHLCETIIPFFENSLFTKKKNWRMNLASKLYFLFVPEILSVYPKKKNYTTGSRFKDFGLFDISNLGWEEYLWMEKPFGLHIKGGTQKYGDIGYKKLREILFKISYLA